MKKIFKFLPLVFASLFLASCEEYEAGSDFVQDLDLVAYTFSNHNYTVTEEQPFYDVRVHATSVSNVDRVLNVTNTFGVNGTTEVFTTVPTTITIPANQLEGTARMHFDFDALAHGKIYTTTLSLANGNEAFQVIDNKKTFTINLTKYCEFPMTTLAITFDDYSQETSWEIYDQSNTNVVLFESDPYAAGTETVTESLCLPPSSYFLVFYDAPYADGFCCDYGEGGYELTYQGNILASGPGSFTSFMTVPFVID